MRPALNGLMRRRHVGIDGGVPAAQRTADMAGNPLAALKHLDGGRGHPHVDLLPDETERHRVVMAGDFDALVDADRGHLPFGKFIPLAGQGTQRRLVEFGKGTGPTAGQFLEGTLIELRQQAGNLPVQFIEAEEALPT